MLSEPLHSRDRTEELIVLRRAALRQQQWLAQRPTADGAATTGTPSSSGPADLAAPSDGAAAAASANSQAGASAAASVAKPPPWVRVLAHFDELEATVAAKMERLHAAQTEFFNPKFVSADEEEEQKNTLQGQQHDIQKLMKELERMVVSGIRAADPNNGDEVVAAANVQRLLSHRLATLATGFKDGQQWFADNLKRREAKVKRFNKLGSAETQEKLEREEKIAGYLELGYTQADIQELLVMDRQAEETSKEVRDIMSSIQEIHQMFADLKTLVDEQGTIIDRIDYNVEEAGKKISGGLKELQKARVEQKKCAAS